jgi:hypothetical protein
LGDGRRVVSLSEFRAVYKAARDGAYVHMNATRRVLEARKIIASDGAHLWRIG